MRELTSHKVNGLNEALKIEVLDEPGSGGACHTYRIDGFDTSTHPSVPPRYGTVVSVLIPFQNGPILEAGVNGITHEALLAILEDRLAGFQSGPYACPENAAALQHIQAAQEVLKARTTARLARGVEGTHKV